MCGRRLTFLIDSVAGSSACYQKYTSKHKKKSIQNLVNCLLLSEIPRIRWTTNKKKGGDACICSLVSHAPSEDAIIFSQHRRKATEQPLTEDKYLRYNC